MDIKKIRELHKITCEVLGVDFDKSLEKTRKREFCEARHTTLYIANVNNKLIKASLAVIGRALYSIEKPNGYDHATVLHAKKTIKNLLDINGYYVNGMNVHTTIEEIINKFSYYHLYDNSINKLKIISDLSKDELIHLITGLHYSFYKYPSI